MTTNKAEVYRAGDGFRWRIIAPENGLIIGSSSEAYTRREDALANLTRVTGGTLPSDNITIREQAPNYRELREGLADDEDGAS